jgi:hypothetical protein
LKPFLEVRECTSFVEILLFYFIHQFFRNFFMLP